MQFEADNTIIVNTLRVRRRVNGKYINQIYEALIDCVSN